MALETFGSLMRDRRMTGEMWRVLGVLTQVLTWGNRAYISRAEIADAERMHPQHVSRAIGRLRALGVLLSGTKRYYQLSARYAHLGAPGSRGRMLSDELARSARQAAATRLNGIQEAGLRYGDDRQTPVDDE